MNTKQSFLMMALLLTASAAQAQVTVPFDVPSPAWEMLVTVDDERDEPNIYRQPDINSDWLVHVVDSGYCWKSPAAPLGEDEFNSKLVSWEHYPIPGTKGEWAGVEIQLERLEWKVGRGWALAENLKKVQTNPLTQDELAEKVATYTWMFGDETYYITSVRVAISEVGGEEKSHTIFFVGKLKNGYLISPYYCKVDRNPGGVAGDPVPELKDFTPEDAEYVLQHAKSFDRGMCRVAYGYYEKGQKQIGSLLTRLLKSSEDNDEACDAPDQIAVYPGNITEDIARGVRYPAECSKAELQGRVIASFVVEKDGSVSDIKVIKGIHPALDREVGRAIHNLKRFSPAKKGGKAVRMRMTVPILFRL